jgi:hypothetical protein
MVMALPRTSDAVVLVPGIMGSELVNASGTVVWGMRLRLLARQALMKDVLDRLALPVDLSADGIVATGPLRSAAHLPLLSSMEPYDALERRLRTMTLAPEAVLAFGYDWRRSIEDAGRKLAGEARMHLQSWRARFAQLPVAETADLPEPRLSLVCHSMGGLVARWFAEVEGGGDVVRQIVTLGTPFAGSLNAVQVLADGDYLPFGLYADAFRDAARTMPGLHELVARYRCVDEGGPNRAITPADLGAIGASVTLAERAQQTHARLDAAVQAAGDDRCRVRSAVGTLQPTRQSVSFANGTAEFSESIGGIDERGDGTVYRYAASLKGGEPSPLPQTHGALARTEEAIAFVQAALTDRELQEFQGPSGVGLRVPEAVRPRARFEAELLDGEPGALCLAHDAESGVQVDMAQVMPRDGRLIAAMTLPHEGVFRISVANSGFTAVQKLVLALAD